MAGIDVNSLLSVSRQLPAPSADGATPTSNIRGGRYREQYILSPVRKNHLLVDEGVFFTTFSGNVVGAAAGVPGTSGQAISPAAQIAFSDTVCGLILRNNDAASNVLAKRVYVDNVTLVCAVTPSVGNTTFRLAIKTDSINRFSSGGVQLTPTNIAPSLSSSSICQVQFGNITATAASQAARVICNLNMRTVAVPIGDVFLLNAGGVEANATGAALNTVAAIALTLSIPPIVLAPGETALFHFFGVGQSQAPVMELLMNHWER